VNPDIDDLIRDAVRRQEELAVDPDRIRAALPARPARRRRTFALATVGVAVAVAAAVPVIVLREPASGDGPAATPTVVAVTPGIPLRYRPTWLPAGFVERSRSVPVVDPAPAKVVTDRIWKRTSLDEGEVGHIGLSVWDEAPDRSDGAGDKADTNGGSGRVDINGSPGRYDNDTVTWQVGNTQFLLYAPGAGLSEDDLLRVARSVEPDRTSLRAPLRVDWLPDGVSGEFMFVRGDSPAKWEARFFAEGAAGYVSVSVGTAVVPARGDEVAVGDRGAHLAEVDEEDPVQANHRTHWVLSADLGGGRYLTVRVGASPGAVQGPLPGDVAIRVAESVVLAPDPDLAWLGH